MYYRRGRGVVPTDENTSIRNRGDAYFDRRVLAVVWMRPGGGGTSGGSLRSSRQAVA